MRFEKRKLKNYSILGFGLIIAAITFINISWKTDENNYPTKHKSILKEDETGINKKNPKAILFINYINKVYQDALLKEANLALPVFEKALIGFYNLKNNNQLNEDKQIITVIDFSKPSTEKRMWIIDLKNNKLLLNTYVAHGQGSGENMAQFFSNTEESHKSSLGFYVTNETYLGKHGLSLRLDGFDKGINDKARDRDIVIHGAEYVSENFIKSTGRLGRSFGCPAVPVELTNTIIDLIKNKTCLFINGNNEDYQSQLLNEEMAFNNFSTSTHS
ncbi:murein L,D-transpeptidase catalytic domain family protein [Pelobium sp.]|nr:murein L,D-transpeptidase catalytic domain family protein [Pelobium sp.]MDA9555189.1 murein L,D-transpeptidase catalytic domain family protein [Pelobium sp.]